MPLYEFHCETDGAYEVVMSMKEYHNQQPCPKCGVIGERRITTAATLIFKGKGWSPAPPPRIPTWISKLSDQELDEELGLDPATDANATA